MPPERLTISTANTLFNGIPIKENGDGPDVLDWLHTHIRMIRPQHPDFVRSRLENGDNIVDDIVGKFDPDILILNEVLPDISGETESKLHKNGYGVVVGRSTDIPYPFALATVIASKWEGQEIPYELPGTSSGSCGLLIPDIQTIVLAQHPSAYSRKTREMQLAHIAQFTRRLMHMYPAFDIVIAGDLNADHNELEPFINNLPLVDHHRPTFPSHRLFESMNRSKIGRIIRYVLGVHKGQRALDHILVPKHWSTPEVTVHETTSDHMALVMEWNRNINTE